MLVYWNNKRCLHSGLWWRNLGIDGVLTQYNQGQKVKHKKEKDWVSMSNLDYFQFLPYFLSSYPRRLLALEDMSKKKRMPLINAIRALLFTKHSRVFFFCHSKHSEISRSPCFLFLLSLNTTPLKEGFQNSLTIYEVMMKMLCFMEEKRFRSIFTTCLGYGGDASAGLTHPTHATHQ